MTANSTGPGALVFTIDPTKKSLVVEVEPRFSDPARRVFPFRGQTINKAATAVSGFGRLLLLAKLKSLDCGGSPLEGPLDKGLEILSSSSDWMKKIARSLERAPSPWSKEICKLTNATELFLKTRKGGKGKDDRAFYFENRWGIKRVELVAPDSTSLDRDAVLRCLRAIKVPESDIKQCLGRPLDSGTRLKWQGPVLNRITGCFSYGVTGHPKEDIRRLFLPDPNSDGPDNAAFKECFIAAPAQIRKTMQRIGDWVSRNPISPVDRETAGCLELAVRLLAAGLVDPELMKKDWEFIGRWEAGPERTLLTLETHGVVNPLGAEVRNAAGFDRPVDFKDSDLSPSQFLPGPDPVNTPAPADTPKAGAQQLLKRAKGFVQRSDPTARTRAYKTRLLGTVSQTISGGPVSTNEGHDLARAELRRRAKERKPLYTLFQDRPVDQDILEYLTQNETALAMVIYNNRRRDDSDFDAAVADASLIANTLKHFKR